MCNGQINVKPVVGLYIMFGYLLLLISGLIRGQRGEYVSREAGLYLRTDSEDNPRHCTTRHSMSAIRAPDTIVKLLIVAQRKPFNRAWQYEFVGGEEKKFEVRECGEPLFYGGI